MNKIKELISRYKTYIIWVAITLAAGGLAALFSGNYEFYQHLKKPPLSPPGWIFPVVWSILYILMGISAGKIADSNDLEKPMALKLYAVQLLINVLWPIIFFNAEMPKTALFVLALLITAVILTFRSFKRINDNAAYLLIPYIIWILFAFYLNFGIVALNS